MSKTLRFITLMTVTLLTGCVGYNNALFVTKTNVGLDVDTKPPTFETSIARRELVIAPSFEDGKTPPVEASFRVKEGSGTWIFADVATTFTGGDAAFIMAKLFNDPKTPINEFESGGTNQYDSTLYLQQEPVGKIFFKTNRLHAVGTVSPLVFGTDTTLGLKVAWSGMTAQWPDSVKFGFHRKEVALAPVYGRTITNGDARGNYAAKMASFLATMESDVTVQGQTNKLALQQYFATGKAADYLALRPEVRKAMAERLDPVAATAFKMKEDVQRGSKLSDEVGKAIDALNSASRVEKATQVAKDLDIVLPVEADELNAIGKTDLGLAKNKLKSLAADYGGLSAENNARLEAYLAFVKTL
ncbi:MAG: hypothetical protein RL380_359 [Verrucomicrobiota bacterium]